MESEEGVWIPHFQDDVEGRKKGVRVKGGGPTL
jgi:hypothetical protein